MKHFSSFSLLLPATAFRIGVPAFGWRLGIMLLVLLVLLGSAHGARAQTTLITASFESGLGSFTSANAGNNKWYTGNNAGSTLGSRAAYIDKNNPDATPAYNKGMPRVSHIYATTGAIPAGQPILLVSFDWKSEGEEDYDYLRVWLAPASYTPTAGTEPFGAGVVALSPELGQQGGAFVSASYGATVTPGSSYRVIFTWVNDDSQGSDPPAAVDNVVVTSRPPLNGTYYVGTSSHSPLASFATLTAAAAAYNAGSVAGPVSFVLIDGNYNNEALPIAFNANAAASATNTLTIKPDAGVNATIRGSSAIAIIELNGADYVTLDGSNNGSTSRNLLVANNAMDDYAAVVFLSSPTTTNGATNNVVKNLVVVGGTNSASSYQVGIGLLGIDPSYLGNNNDNNTLSNNIFTQVAVGIDAEASSNNPYDNLVIADNQIGPAVAADAENMSLAGIVLAQTPGAQVTHNTVRNVTGYGSDIPYGIALSTGTAGAVLERNIVRSIHNVTTSGYGVVGIGLAPGSGTANVVVRNNVVSDIWADGDDPGSDTDYGIMGIGVFSGTGYSLYNNSVQMSGNRANNSFTSKVSAALFVVPGATGLDVRNNVLSNIQTTSDPDANGVGTNYAVYVQAASGTPFSTINYNLYDLRSGAAARTTAVAPQFVGRLGGTDVTTLAAWQTATTQDRSSMVTAAGHTAGFTSALDLTPNPADPNAYALNGTGVQLTSVSVDLAGTARPTTATAGAPDLGAYQFMPTSQPNTLEVTGTYAPGGTQSFYFNSRLVATITYAGTGTLPGTLTARYFPGTNPPNPYPVLAHYQNSYFTLVPSGASGAGYSYQLALSYDPALLGIVAAANQLRQSQMLPAVTSYHTDLTSTVSTAARTFTSGVALTAFGTFTGSEAAAPLPVELVSFEAVRRGNDAELSWLTASEKNNQGFDVQVSANGQEFRTLQTVVPASPGSTAPRHYTHTDREVGKAGLRYYRLRQVDLDGTASFSPVRALSFAAADVLNGLSLAPNPFNTATTLTVQASTASRTVLTVTDAKGRTVLMQELALPAGQSQLEIQGLATLVPGLYLLHLLLNDEVRQLKVVKQ